MAKASKSTKAASSVFSAPPVIVTSATASKGKSDERPIAGIQRLAAIRAMEVWLKALKTDADRLVKEQMSVEYVTEGMALNRRPENFTGVEGFGRGSCQLRASSVALTPEQIAIYDAHKIVLDKATVTEETLIFNPEYANDPKVVALLDKKFGAEFADIQDERGPIIMKQEGVKKITVSDAGRDAIFKHDDKTLVRELMDSGAFQLAVRVTMDTDGDFRPALEEILGLLDTDLGKEIAKEAANDADALDKRVSDKPKRAPRAKKAAA